MKCGVGGAVRRRIVAVTAAVVCGCVMVTGCVGGQDADPEAGVSVQEDSFATLTDTVVERIEYPTAGLADSDQNWADLYLPKGPQKRDTIPLVVLIHGGAWQSQLGADTFAPLARDLAERGMAVYNIEYRRVGSGGGWPTTFHDVANALDHVVEVDRKYPQLTTDDELVVGHSAGAQLAVWGGTRHTLADDEVGSKPAFRPTRVVSLAGPLDMVYSATHGDTRIVTVLGGPPSQFPARYAEVDPIQNIDTATPVVAIHGTADRLVSPVNSTRYAQTARARGARATAILLNGEDHGSLVSSDAVHYNQILDTITGASHADINDVAR